MGEERDCPRTITITPPPHTILGASSCQLGIYGLRHGCILLPEPLDVFPLSLRHVQELLLPTGNMIIAHSPPGRPGTDQPQLREQVLDRRQRAPRKAGTRLLCVLRDNVMCVLK